MSKKVLFVCRGNAFRSIIAETYLKSKQLPDLEVASAGTIASQHYNQNRPTFSRTMDILGLNGIDRFAKDHHGDQLTQEMLDSSDEVILINDIVHQEVKQAGLNLPSQTHVWNIADIGEVNPLPLTKTEISDFGNSTYQAICAKVDELAKLF